MTKRSRNKDGNESKKGNLSRRRNSQNCQQSCKDTSSNAILCIKRAKKCLNPLKVLLKDEEEYEVKEYIPRFEDGDPRGNLLTLHMTSFRLARKYGYFIDGKWKRIAQAVGRALDGKCEEQWDDL